MEGGFLKCWCSTGSEHFIDLLQPPCWLVSLEMLWGKLCLQREESIDPIFMSSCFKWLDGILNNCYLFLPHELSYSWRWESPEGSSWCPRRSSHRCPSQFSLAVSSSAEQRVSENSMSHFSLYLWLLQSVFYFWCHTNIKKYKKTFESSFKPRENGTAGLWHIIPSVTPEPGKFQTASGPPVHPGRCTWTSCMRKISEHKPLKQIHLKKKKVKTN